ncbi:hypothetical protein BV898_00914 [Hypsibius exemplaris]|uniref:Uncharacterized protein n=1 Tax=Hypsibius exemplaris TaxID=2072580 RepID=A0A1W0XCJ9_HYPEX|nr:hypothetical protein BV898_00914 [Hypsibius exemplaris]
MVRAKTEILRASIWKSSALSTCLATLPIPLFSASSDLTIVWKQSNEYFQQLGLDNDSLQKTALMNNADLNSLKLIVKSITDIGTVPLAYVKEMVKFAAWETVVEEAVHLVPVVGTAIAAAMSFGTTQYTLNKILTDMERVALEVMRTAVQQSAARAALD